MADRPYKGVFPIVPTPFGVSGELDLESQRRVIDCMVEQGNDGLCLLANYSEQFALSDRERDTLLDVCMEHLAGRLPAIVTCSHYSTGVAVERARRAEAAGAAMVMMMPPYHGALLRADEASVFEHFAAVAEAIAIPIMVQDAPLSGVQLSVPVLCRLATELPAVAYLKIETPGTADKLRALIAGAGDAIEGPFDGEESITLMADLDAGATGTMCSAMLPDLIKPVVDSYSAGRRDEAAERYNRILPLINYENRQCGLRACKVIMKEGGVIASDTVRHPQAPLPEPARRGLLELAMQLEPLALGWAS
jgi:4-hydroxy-tetrahydrodipicolinate synthase